MPKSQLSSSIDLSENYISKLNEQDKNLLEEMVRDIRPASKAYEDSWGYIIQATRYNGFKLWDFDSKTLIFFSRKPEDEKTLVVPNFFAKPDSLIKVFPKVIALKHCNKIVLKNIDSRNVERFLRLGFRQYAQNENWDKFTKYDDQTYPQPIVNITQAIKMMGNKYRNLRNQVRRNGIYQLRSFNDSDLQEVLTILKRKEKGKYFDSHVMYPTADLEKFVVTFNNVIEGFIAVSSISSATFALNASIILSKHRGVGVWASYQVFLKKKLEGFKYVNLGGSENPGTYTFKEWNYKPSTYLNRTHLVYE